MARILFVCTGNTCRSPMAERLARLAHPQHRWESAGVTPGAALNPLAARVLAERAADAASFDSRAVADLDLAGFDHVVLIGDRARRLAAGLPAGPAVHDWDVPDPLDAEGTEAERLAVYRATADALRARIDALSAGLG